MRFGIVVVLACVSPLLADEAKEHELAYLSAWYKLEVEEDPQAAQKAFDALLADENLPAERRAMCTFGLARCAVARGDRQGAFPIFRRALRIAGDHPEVERRIEKALEALGRGAHTGTFRIHYQQGFRFGTDAVVPVGDADLVFLTCAGGISSITFTAPHGILNLESILGRDTTNLEPRQIYAAIAAAFPARLTLQSTAQADSRTPESNVFIMRTRDGGWAKFAVVHREREDPSWQKWPAVILYSYHPDRPLFAPLPANAASEKGPLVFNRELTPTEKELEDRKRALQARVDAAEGGGAMPDHAKTQEVLLNRREFNDYEKATFSFAVGVRDDPDSRRVHNDWDLLYTEGGSRKDEFVVRMVTDDRSTVTDLGASTWAEFAEQKTLQDEARESAPVELGHFYLVHTRDMDADSHAVVRVTAHRPGIACHIQWVSLQGTTLKHSPGLFLTAEQKAALKRLLQNAKRAPEPESR